MDIPPVRQQTAKWGNEAVKKAGIPNPTAQTSSPASHPKPLSAAPDKNISFRVKSQVFTLGQEVGATKTVIFFQPVLEIFGPGVRLVTLVTSQGGLCFVSGASTFSHVTHILLGQLFMKNPNLDQISSLPPSLGSNWRIH